MFWESAGAMQRPLAQLVAMCILTSKIGCVTASAKEFLAKDSATSSVQDCAAACNAVNPAQTCFFDDTCPDLGCNALGREKCRYCGFGDYVGIICPDDLPAPPGTPWKPPEVEPPAWCSPIGVYECDKVCFKNESMVEVNEISKDEGSSYFTNAVTTQGGLQEVEQCSHMGGIGSLNILACTTSSRDQSTNPAQFLQKLRFNQDCEGFDKKVWQMYPAPVKACSTSCRRKHP